jgi:hypothetical protein
MSAAGSSGGPAGYDNGGSNGTGGLTRTAAPKRRRGNHRSPEPAADSSAAAAQQPDYVVQPPSSSDDSDTVAFSAGSKGTAAPLGVGVAPAAGPPQPQMGAAGLSIVIRRPSDGDSMAAAAATAAALGGPGVQTSADAGVHLFEAAYEMGELIGQGTFSTVHKARHRATGEVRSARRVFCVWPQTPKLTLSLSQTPLLYWRPFILTNLSLLADPRCESDRYVPAAPDAACPGRRIQR